MSFAYALTREFGRWRTLTATLALPFALAFCGTRGGESQGESSAADTADAGTQEDDVVTYAEVCKRELGIQGPLPAMSCLAGTEVPITQDGKPISDENYASLATTGCDNPQWLERACYNYDFVQRIDVGPDVEAVLNCRQKYFTTAASQDARKAAFAAAPDDKKVDAYKALAEFNDLGLILRNVKTGKSCFFTIFGKQFFGGYLPPPDARATPTRDAVLAALKVPAPPVGYPEAEVVRDARATYLTPRETAGGNCVGCHDQSAFTLSPFIQQVNVVPPPQTKTLPYFLVGSVFQEAFRSARLLDVTTAPIAGQPQSCTSCHRMTSGGSTCSTFLDWSIGKDPSPHSPRSKEYPQAAWMPPQHGAKSAAEHETRYGAHVKRMKCCCEKPFARGCKTRPFGPTPQEMGPVPPGETLPAWRDAPSDASESCLDGEEIADAGTSADAGTRADAGTSDGGDAGTASGPDAAATDAASGGQGAGDSPEGPRRLPKGSPSSSADEPAPDDEATASGGVRAPRTGDGGMSCAAASPGVRSGANVAAFGALAGALALICARRLRTRRRPDTM